MTSRITLSPAGAVELELVLTGGLGTPVYGTTGDAGLLPVNGDLGNAAKVELLDEEGTPLAAVVIDGAADENGGRWLRGSVEQLRPFGHLRHRERRIGRDTVRADRAIVVLGDLPLAKDSRWNELDQRMLVLLDTGHHADALSRDVRHAVAAGHDVRILPAPDPSLRDLETWREAVAAAARTLVADDIELWHTERSVGEGVVILLTGLSGSGKSTIAKLLAERLSQVDDRTVSLLDGDEVRLVLSSGLGFSREDRLMNVQRIGWVASLIAKHGGIAVCAPIAPYEIMRAEMRERVEKVGRFVLVHVSTPLEVCEQRDRKGLYAKARAGEIPQFTGISDSYEEPTDADLVIDASVVSPDDAVDQIVGFLEERSDGGG